MTKINLERIFGWMLLIAGIVIITYSAVNVINTFTGKVDPYNLFSFESIGLDFSNLTDQPLPTGTDLKQTLVEKDLLNKPLNLTAHLFLMGFITSVGFKIAQLGTMLARPVKLNLIRKDDVEVQKT